jgi:hypothetical protein
MGVVKNAAPCANRTACLSDPSYLKGGACRSGTFLVLLLKSSRPIMFRENALLS